MATLGHLRLVNFLGLSSRALNSSHLRILRRVSIRRYAVQTNANEKNSKILILDEELYKDYVPKDFRCEDVITYQWKESRADEKIRGKFSFYLNITRNSVSSTSMIVYFLLVLIMPAPEPGLR